MSDQDQDQPLSERLCVGKIATAHGVKGLVKILVYADDPQLLNGKILTSEKTDSSLTILMKNSMGKYWLAAVDGISDRNEAESLRGTKLWIERCALPVIDIDEEEFYVNDLVGLEAYNSSQKKIATITAVDNYGAGDLLELTLADGSSFLLPFTKNNVPKIDLHAGRVTLGDITPYLDLANQ